MAHVVTLNAGSSSLKTGLYALGAAEPRPLARGHVDRIGDAAQFSLEDAAGRPLTTARLAGAADHAAALGATFGALATAFADLDIRVVGHRIVHGGLDHTAPADLTPEVLEALAALVPFAPLHQPHNLAGVRAAMAAFPGARQIGCFDTAFHRGHPFVNDTFALPRRFYDDGVRRYGFHGLSYAYIAGALQARSPALHAGRVVVAHLGNGASMCAMREGRSVASSMGFSALDGLPMGTRSGQIDPGVILYLLDQEGLSSAEIADLLYRRSGLLGLSGVSGDMRRLLASDKPAAREAIDYFCFRAKRELGGLAAALGGLDALVFTGGIGENAHEIRAEICRDMGWIGIDLDPDRNAAAATEISTDRSGVRVLVLPTDEELVIARAAAAATAREGR